MENLYSYKMVHDDRFAPNPFWGHLTLAVCKPYIRLNVRVGDWISGWTSKSLRGASTEVGKEKLLYLARVSEKLTFEQYWNDPRFENKKPGRLDDKNDDKRFGDNIYKPDSSAEGGFVQVKNLNHVEKNKKKDLKGQFVLVCGEFYYFGKKSPLDIPLEFKPNIPKAQSAYGSKTEEPTDFINYVRKHVSQCYRSSHI